MGELNCHYVSRFATRAFEVVGRYLWVCDLAQRAFRLVSSKSLLAAAGTNSKQTEDRLNKLVETPISQALAAGRLLQPFVDWRVRRAIALALRLQGARAANALTSSPIDLATLLRLSDAEIDQVVMRELEANEVGMVELPDDERLFYPQVGFFAFPASTPDHIVPFEFGFAMPVTPRRALVMYPKPASVESIRELLEAPHMFMGLSLGAPESSRLIVVPPEIKDANDEHDLVDTMIGLRTHAQDVVANANKVRQLAADALRKVGLGPLLTDRH